MQIKNYNSRLLCVSCALSGIVIVLRQMEARELGVRNRE